MSEPRTFEISKAVLPIGGAIFAILTIVGLIAAGIMFITNLASSTNQNTKDVESLTARVNAIDVSQQGLSTKQSVLDVKIDTILDRIQEIKTSLEKTTSM